jgi:hypothetical protein
MIYHYSTLLTLWADSVIFECEIQLRVNLAFLAAFSSSSAGGSSSSPSAKTFSFYSNSP